MYYTNSSKKSDPINALQIIEKTHWPDSKPIQAILRYNKPALHLYQKVSNTRSEIKNVWY